MGEWKIKEREILTFKVFLFFTFFFVSHSFALEGSNTGQGTAEDRLNKVFTMESGEPAYLIGKGDILDVTIWEGIEEHKSEAEVKHDGTIAVSFVDAKADGLTVIEVAESLKEELKKYVKQPRVGVKVKEFKSKNVTLSGAVQSLVRQPTGPGVYPLKGKVTLSYLIISAGGFARDANLSNVQVIDINGRFQVVNLLDLFFKGDLSKDIVLDDGDTIFIPSRVEMEDNIFVFGEVKNPGVYPLKEGTTVIQALGMAGGYSEKAFLQDIRVIRGGLSSPNIIDADVDIIINEGHVNKDVTLKNNDILFVPKTRIWNWNAFLAKLKPTLEFVTLPFVTVRTINSED